MVVVGTLEVDEFLLHRPKCKCNSAGALFRFGRNAMTHRPKWCRGHVICEFLQIVPDV